MPQIRVQPVKTGSAAIIIGNGPSCREARWYDVVRRLRKECADLAVVLINGRALGRNAPDYAVAVGPEVLAKFQQAELHDRCTVITNAPHKVVGPEAARSELAGLFFSRGVLFGKDNWPPHASGPLAVWAMTALGYETIYLYGLDGTVQSPAGNREKLPSGVRPDVWETWIRRYMKARDAGFNPHDRRDQPRLVRVWPAQTWCDQRDPLQGILHDTLVLDREDKSSKPQPT